MAAGFVIDYIIPPSLNKEKTIRIRVAHPSTGYRNFLNIDVVKKDRRFRNRWMSDDSGSNIYTEAAADTLWVKAQPYRMLLGFIFMVAKKQGYIDFFGVNMRELFGKRQTMNMKKDPEAMTVYEYVNDLKEHAVFSAYQREDDF